MDSYPMTGLGVPIFAQAGYFTNDAVKGIVIGYPECVVCMPLVYEEFIETPYYLVEFGAGITAMHAMDIVPGDGLDEILILEDDTVFVFAMGELELELYGYASFPGAILIAPGNADGSRLAVVKPTELEIYSWSTDPTAIFALENSGELPFNRRVREIVSAELTDGGYSDFLVRSAGITYILKQLEEGFELYEFVGYPDGEQDARVLIADIDGDTHPDLVVARAEYTHQVFLNRERLVVSVGDADAVEKKVDGATYLKFLVELDAPPVSLVVVTVGLEEIPPEESSGAPDPGWEGEQAVLRMLCGFDTRIPDPGEFAKAQFVPTPIAAIPASFYGLIQMPVFFQPPIGQWTVTIPVSIGVVVSPSLGFGVVNPVTTPSYDWELDGEVNATAQDGQGRVYLGGDFTGMTWEIHDGLAAIDIGGRRLHAIAPSGATSMTIEAIASDAGNNLYVGGSFTFVHNGVTIRNIARITPAGEWDETFRPNPNGAVHAIAIDDVFGWIYFGGRFDRLQHQTTPALDARVRNVARVLPAMTDAQIFQGYTPTAVNAIRVSWQMPGNNMPATGNGTTINDSASVLSLALVDSPDGRRLVIGGRDFRSIRFGSGTTGYYVGRNARQAVNLAIVVLNASANYQGGLFPRHIGNAAPFVMRGTTDPTSAQNSARVLSVAAATQPGSFFTDNGPGWTEPAMVFSGDFERVRFRAATAGWITNADCLNLGISTLDGHRPDVVEPGRCLTV